jgi:hypothetical protein
MKKLWEFLSAPQNLAIVVALAAALGFLWKEVIGPKYFTAQPAVVPKQVHVGTTQYATSEGGNAINATDDSRVVIGPQPASAKTSPVTSHPQMPVSQSAKSGKEGTSVNAAGTANVHIYTTPIEKHK